MKDVVKKYLSKLEDMIDLEHQQHAREVCRRVFAFEDVAELPYISGDLSAAPDQDWPQYAYNDTFVDQDKMLLDQLRNTFFHNQLRDYHPLNRSRPSSITASRISRQGSAGVASRQTPIIATCFPPIPA